MTHQNASAEKQYISADYIRQANISNLYSIKRNKCRNAYNIDLSIDSSYSPTVFAVPRLLTTSLSNHTHINFPHAILQRVTFI